MRSSSRGSLGEIDMQPSTEVRTLVFVTIRGLSFFPLLFSFHFLKRLKKKFLSNKTELLVRMGDSRLGLTGGFVRECGNVKDEL